MSKIRRVKFSEIPVGHEFWAYWNPNNPVDFDTFRAIKVDENHLSARGQFESLEVNPDEPCAYNADQ